MKILVVDDEKDIQPLFQQRYRKEIRNGEMEFVFAYSGEEAIECLENYKHEAVLILSDINMPGMTGLELLRRIKEDPPPVPVCMMTAYDNDEFRGRADALS